MTDAKTLGPEMRRASKVCIKTQYVVKFTKSLSFENTSPRGKHGCYQAIATSITIYVSQVRPHRVAMLNRCASFGNLKFESTVSEMENS